MVTRPAAVTVVAISLLAATTIALVTGVTLLFPGTGLDALWQLNERAYSAFTALGTVSGAFLAVLGCVTASAGIGLLRRRRWA
ncbi:hypothetical protein [Tunturibacter empetritectus]|uniref:Membrane protein n=1 Tax=Tunturiibacter lichenicola TaxID=2051959 RepID=A0A7W8J5P8_9BACT|nr:hypothetical protein [Edaphobacter lichenicola]MBB5343033.1 putative membrane protein [Edaphobacter lichenicola]